MTRTDENAWLHRFAVATAMTTLGLIGVGGLVTSHGAGMAVPDWPTTYGYNMFLFPPSYWIGGIFYEHSHRLLASFVGLQTMILAGWLWLKESRRWLRWMGVLALVGVIGQGVLGGLRVTLFKDELGIVHATVAQSFLLLMGFIALATSRWWRRMGKEDRQIPLSRPVRMLGAVVVVLIFIQLMLGATMRHQHAGLAVPDFPLAYGKLWPKTDSEFIERINRNRIDVRDYNNITPFQIHLHMTHRLMACVILGGVLCFAVAAGREMRGKSRMALWVWVWAGMIVLQGVLGAVTVWSNKAADVATGHVVLGAASLVLGALMMIASFCYRGDRVCVKERRMPVREGMESMKGMEALS